MNKRPLTHSARRSVQSGLSLIELLVATAIGLLLLTAVLALYSAMSNATKTSTQEAQLNEDGSLALQIFKQQLQLAGYSGIGTGVDATPNFTGVSVLGCDGGFASTNSDYMASIGAAVTPACGTTATGPDAISVRFQADLQNTVATVSGTNNYPSNCAFELLGAWKSGYALAENRFYVKADTSNNSVPTLFCRGIGSTAAGLTPAFGTEAALIPNVEDLQIQYVVSSPAAAGSPPSPQVSGVVDANNAILGTTLANWSRVAGVQICLVMRSNEPVPLGNATKADVGYYRKCDGTAVTNATDRYLRRAFRTTIAFRNLRPDLPKAYATGGCPWGDAECATTGAVTTGTGG